MNASASREQSRRHWALTALQRYWPGQVDLIAQLPLPDCAVVTDASAPKLQEIALPEWAQDLGVGRHLLVPATAISATTEREVWRHCDWLNVIAWYLDAVAERAHESRVGPIHSYAARLDNWDERLWSRAWVNRIALFLRRWAARQLGQDEVVVFGPLPAARLVLTHDVDALSKTFSIRLKQAMFQAFNSLRAVRDGDFAAARRRSRQFLQVLFSNESYWCFERIFALEKDAETESMFFFHARNRGPRSLHLRVVDPAYDAASAELKRALALTQQHGAGVGLHPSYAAWQDEASLTRERQNLEALTQQPVRAVRQHWLRFSWQNTWTAQARAGLSHDFTAAFNDRPGFRLGAALTFQPFDMHAQAEFVVTPTVMMDSQFYDYAEMSDTSRIAAMTYWVRELHDTRGEAAVIWHQQVFNRDYAWGAGYQALLGLLRASS